MSVAPDSRSNADAVAPAPTAARGRSGLLGAAAVVIWNDVAPEGRTQFYDWHDGEHMPERLALPGFRRGRRARKAGHSPEWLTIYEADDVSALVSPAYLARLNAPTPGTTAALKHFRNTSRAVCRVALSAGSGTGGHVLALRLDASAQRSDSMCAELREYVFPRLVRRTGVLACHLLAADDAASYVDTSESSTRAFDVPRWVLLCEASTLEAADAAARDLCIEALPRIDVQVRADFATYSLESCRLAAAGGSD